MLGVVPASCRWLERNSFGGGRLGVIFCGMHRHRLLDRLCVCGLWRASLWTVRGEELEGELWGGAVGDACLGCVGYGGDGLGCYY